MFEGKRFLPLTGMPILKSARNQHAVGRLAARAVDGGGDNREVIDARRAVLDIGGLETTAGRSEYSWCSSVSQPFCGARSDPPRGAPEPSKITCGEVRKPQALVQYPYYIARVNTSTRNGAKSFAHLRNQPVRYPTAFAR